MKIGTKLLIIIVVLTVLLSVTALSAVLISSSLLESQMQDKYQAISSYAMEKIHRLMLGRYEDVRMLASELVSSRHSTPEQITKKLREFKKHFKTYLPYASLSFFDMSGAPIADTEGTGIGVRLRMNKYRGDTIKSKDFTLDISGSRTPDSRMIDLVHVVKDGNGVPFGLVVAGIRVEALSEVVDRPLHLFKLGGPFDLQLLDGNGAIIYTSNKPATSDAVSLLWKVITETKTSDASKGFAAYVSPENRQEEMLFFAREEKDALFGNNGWTLVISVPKQIALGSIMDLRNRLVLIITVIVFCAVGAGIVLSRAITKPIARLSKAVSAVGKGGLDINVEIVSQDEIGQLTAMFNKMVVELKTLNQELRTMATVDVLTRAYTRNMIEQVLRREIDRASRYGTPLSLLLIDLDHFKTVNDTHGHLTGDYVLKTVVGIIQAHIRTSDSLARWGGEEFMLLAPETSVTQAVALADKIRQQVRGFGYQSVESITISCGIAEFQTGDTADTLIKRADDALYKAKRMGRDRVETSTDAQQDESEGLSSSDRFNDITL